jgi:rSAM-associated Gly-rich repeat protein
MNITNKIGWAAFLVAIATLNLSAAEATVSSQPNQVSKPTVEARLERIVNVLKTRETQLPQTESHPLNLELAVGWGNTRGSGFVNTRGPGWGNVRGGGGFVNVNPWRNGWGDGGSFINRR